MSLTFFISVVVVYLLLLRAFMPAESASCSSPGQPTFLTQPSDIVVKDGANASFTCSASHYNPDTDALFWNVNPSVFYSLMSREFNESNQVMKTTITFINVNRTRQTQQCVLYIMNEKMQLITCRSRIATISVQYFPGTEDITCGPKKLPVLHDGQVLPIWCKVPLGNPPVELKWHDIAMQGRILRRTYQEQGMHVQAITQDVYLSHLIHNRTATCEATSKIAFPNLKLTCSTGPFIVHYKPVVHISLQPSAAATSFKQGENVQLKCTAHAYPDITQLLWVFTPTDITDGYKTIVGNTVVIDTSQIRINTSLQLVAKCTVRNSIGMSEASVNLTLLPSLSDRRKDECQDYSLTVNQLITAKHSFLHSGWNVTFLCSVVGPQFDMEKHRFLWYYDDVMVENTSVDIFPMHSKTIGQSAIQLISVLETDNCKQVKCKFVDESCPDFLAGASSLKIIQESLCDKEVIGDARNVTYPQSKDLKGKGDHFPGGAGNRSSTLLKVNKKNTKLSMRFILIFAFAGIVMMTGISSLVSYLLFKHFKHRHRAASTAGHPKTDFHDVKTFEKIELRATERQRPSTEVDDIYEDPSLFSDITNDVFISPQHLDANYDNKIHVFCSDSMSISDNPTSSTSSLGSFHKRDSSSGSMDDSTSENIKGNVVHNAYQNWMM